MLKLILHAHCSKVSLKLAAGCSEENMVELLAGIPGVQPVGKRSSWLNYRYFVHFVSSPLENSSNNQFLN